MISYDTFESYLGKYPMEEILANNNEWVLLARGIRTQLGDQADLLDEYLKGVFLALSNPFFVLAMSHGCQQTRELQILCNAIVDGKESNEITCNPIYPAVKHHIECHPLEFPAQVKKQLYLIQLLPEYRAYALDRYQHKASDILEHYIGDQQISELCEKMYIQLGGARVLEELNMAIEQQFQLVMPMESFVQGMNYAQLEALLQPIDEQDMHIFQYLIDAPPRDDI